MFFALYAGFQTKATFALNRSSTMHGVTMWALLKTNIESSIYTPQTNSFTRDLEQYCLIVLSSLTYKWLLLDLQSIIATFYEYNVIVVPANNFHRSCNHLLARRFFRTVQYCLSFSSWMVSTKLLNFSTFGVAFGASSSKGNLFLFTLSKSRAILLEPVIIIARMGS